MQRKIIILCACLSFLGIAFVASTSLAADKIYANGDFKFQMSYPENWKMKDESPTASFGKSFGGFGIKKEVKLGNKLGFYNFMCNCCKYLF